MAIVLTVVAVGLLGVLVLQGRLLLHLRDQQSRIHRRIDDLARRAASPRRPDPLAAVPAARIAPPFALPSLAGPATSLANLLAPVKPLVLIFVDPRCGPCYPLLPDIGGWQRVDGDRLSVALVSAGTAETNRAMTAEYGIAAATVLLQREHEVADAYDVRQGPAAVLIGPDGRLHGEPVYGAHAVRRLVADALGVVAPNAPSPTIEAGPAVRLGDRLPALRRPDLAGRVVDFADLRGETTLLLFWSPGCGHCQALLPAIREWEERPDGPRLLVITSGPVGLNQAVGLRSPMVADDDGSLKRTFGVQATPSAVVVDALGFVASDVGRGANAIRDLVAQRFVSVPLAAD